MLKQDICMCRWHKLWLVHVVTTILQRQQQQKLLPQQHHKHLKIHFFPPQKENEKKKILQLDIANVHVSVVCYCCSCCYFCFITVLNVSHDLWHLNFWSLLPQQNNTHQATTRRNTLAIKRKSTEFKLFSKQ